MPAWDAIIVGAGPAGISAAMAILRLGGKPLLIDKKSFPREKACAGMLSAAAIASSPFNLVPAICAVSSAILWKEHGRERLLHEQNLLSHRIELDDYLFRQAIASGVTFRQVPNIIKLRQSDNEVRLTTSQKELLIGSHVIAADGANSQIRRLLNLPSAATSAFAIEADLELPVEAKITPALFDFDTIPAGYGWHFPKGSTSNLGIAFMRGNHGNVAKAFESFINRHGKCARKLGRSRGAAIGSYGAATCLGTGRLLLCGDAAGLADPWTGEGISTAFQSGHAAGTAVMQNLRHKEDALAYYEKTLSNTLEQLKKRSQHLTTPSYGMSK